MLSLSYLSFFFLEMVLLKSFYYNKKCICNTSSSFSVQVTGMSMLKILYRQVDCAAKKYVYDTNLLVDRFQLFHMVGLHQLRGIHWALLAEYASTCLLWKYALFKLYCRLCFMPVMNFITYNHMIYMWTIAIYLKIRSRKLVIERVLSLLWTIG